MNIQFKNDNEKFQLKESVIREKRIYCDDGKYSNMTHFQAILSDQRKNNTNLDCSLTYYDNNEAFLGFDSIHVWTNSTKTELPISMPVTIPDEAVKGVFQIMETKTPKNNEHLIVIVVCIIAVAIIIGLDALNKL